MLKRDTSQYMPFKISKISNTTDKKSDYHNIKPDSERQTDGQSDRTDKHTGAAATDLHIQTYICTMSNLV